MDDFKLVIDELMVWIKTIYNFFTGQHPIVQARVFLPLALLVVTIFIGFVGRNERSV